EENARLNASVAMLQMRPHFICNTMTSIYYLIEQDQKKAQRVTKDFTSYLRKNLTAVCKEGEIPFTDELEHTRAYLSVEQVRYEGRLSVSFDTPVTNFRLPPLTLQPLVENAVKHGLSPENGPLEISVRTAQTGDGTEITVEDTGPGFVEDNSGDGAHIGLSNVRSRLSAVGGALKISPRDGGGTVVTVVLPGKK
ncbi:MAG: histidine kinase, partial [Clostridia bacterium]|nr:histidine kinase [Clostridia bacterium]